MPPAFMSLEGPKWNAFWTTFLGTLQDTTIDADLKSKQILVDAAVAACQPLVTGAFVVAAYNQDGQVTEADAPIEEAVVPEDLVKQQHTKLEETVKAYSLRSIVSNWSATDVEQDVQEDEEHDAAAVAEESKETEGGADAELLVGTELASVQVAKSVSVYKSKWAIEYVQGLIWKAVLYVQDGDNLDGLVVDLTCVDREIEIRASQLLRSTKLFFTGSLTILPNIHEEYRRDWSNSAVR